MIRDFCVADLSAVVALSLRAWAPVFESLRGVLGPALFDRLQPDWLEQQAAAVRDTCGATDVRVWVAEVDSVVAGFVAARLADSGIGEIYMIAVDPPFQRRGVASSLIEVANRWFADNGMTVAMVETGGDPGHAPARDLYEHN